MKAWIAIHSRTNALRPGHQCQSYAVDLSRLEFHPRDQDLDPFCCVQSVQSRHRVRKRDHVIASKPECGDSPIGKIGFVMNNDNAGGHKRAPFAG